MWPKGCQCIRTPCLSRFSLDSCNHLGNLFLVVSSAGNTFSRIVNILRITVKSSGSHRENSSGDK